MKSKKNNKKVLVVIIIVILLLSIIGIYSGKKNNEKSIKEIVEGLGHTYYKQTISNEKDFDMDIYVSISYKPIEDRGISNQSAYEKLIKGIASKVGDSTYRIVDENQQIVIRAKSENKSVQYTINGIKKFFETELAKNNKKQKEGEIKNNINVKSNELMAIMQIDWNRAKSKEILGTVDKNVEDYDYYFDEGYYVKTRNLKIFNIIFTKEYKGEVFYGIETGNRNENIRKVLGNPDFVNDMNCEVNGYKTNNFYVFFSNGEISIYPTQELDKEKNNQFANITTDLVNNGDTDRFLNELTNIYPNYDTYEKNEEGVAISYPILGIKIEIDKNKKYRYILYSNYQGKITNEINMEDIEKGKELPKNIIIESLDGVFYTELQRLQKNYKSNK